MIELKTLTGQWKNIERGIEGTVDSTLTARAIKGSELDEKYDVYAILKLIGATTKSASVIVSWSYNIDWDEYYL